MVLIGRWTARQCCIAVGYVFPMYKSSRALRRQDKPELLQWITFWMTNALFWALELIGDTAIGWMPFYYEAKIALLLWLVLPQYKGARMLHEIWLAPTFEKHEDVIDDALTDIKRRASEKVVQVCKDTAVLALRRGSGVVVQGQQFVAAQLVQQAMSKLQQQSTQASEAQELRGPTMLSMLTAAGVAMAAATTAQKSSSIAPPAMERSEPKDKPSTVSKPPHDKKKVVFEDKIAEEKTTADDSDEDASSDAKQVQQVAKKIVVQTPKRVPSPPKAAAIASTAVAAAPPLAAAARTQEKSKELLSHFKKLLVKGFALKYYPYTPPSSGSDPAATGKLLFKHRTLRLQSTQSRYLVFENTTTTSSNKKSVKLFIHNVRRISSGHGAASEGCNDHRVDDSLAFVLDNGKTTLLFEAESQKTRDLVVAGTRLLVNEHKRHDSTALATMVSKLDKMAKQHAFDRMVYVLLVQQKPTSHC